jgi:hypothetical protein
VGNKWDAASRVVNDVRAIFDRNHTEIRLYGLQDTYTDINAFADGLQQRQLPDRVQMALLLAFRDWAPMAFWNEHKQVYTMHPTLTRELRATGVNDKLPGEILQHLPHPDPMFVFPDGIEIELPEGERGSLIAINVCGAHVTGPGHANFASTLDETSNGLYFNALAEVYDEDGTVVDWDYCHTSIPISDEAFTIASVIDDTRDYYSFDGKRATEGMDERRLAYVHQVVGIALAHLLYVSTVDVDIAPPRNTTAAQNAPLAAAGPRRRPRPTKHQPVGYVIGPALDAARREHEKNAATGGGGGTKGPHVRKAHFHTVRTGVGRVDSELRWFAPIPVKMDGAPLKKPTIHGY